MERDGYEKIAYKLLENPKFWFNLDRIKELTGLTYWTEVYRVVDVLKDKEFIAKAKESYEKLGAKYPSETAKIALKNIKAIEEAMRWGRSAVPQTVQRGKEPWQMTREEFYQSWDEMSGGKAEGVSQKEYDKLRDTWRRTYVERAITEGKPVPPEVLRDYPDLVRKVTPVTPEITEHIIHLRRNKYGVEEFYFDYEGKRYEFMSGYKEQVKFRDLRSGKEIEGLIYPSYAYMEEGTVLHMKPKAIPKAEVQKVTPPAIHAVPRCRVPATLHPYAPPARQFEDEMEKLFRSDPAEFYRRKKLVNQAIKERERGKIKTLPDFSLTDLRRIKAHADSLYG